MRTVTLNDGTVVPAIGQGTWMMGDARNRAREVAALKAGMDLGMTLIDTAEMYGDGDAEDLVGEAMAGRRDSLFLVSKVLPSNADKRGVLRACERSLKRLKTDRLDLYLLHWRGGTPLAETVEAFETLIRDGKIRRWGVSNFDVSDMEELEALAPTVPCATNQVLYNPENRGIEFDLLDWHRDRGMPVMAYSPVGQGGKLLASRALASVAARHAVSAAQIAIAWAIRHGDVMAIPKASSLPHVRQNAEASDIVLTPEDLAEIDAAHQPPRRKRPLEML
ncbi:aldo/keto reductase [Chthonobacter rhizosphaerae]|uniref:aldo/keto reductase n=1 Tax=Chthonobacter rhizosphaerae TaxID=2735553 RepID=UPI0015EE4EBF|nr:aldo/keto reductase [Chthonobacter rhizosphaerae]